MNQEPFTLSIFVADGDPDGLRLVEKSNWIGKAVVFPRALLPKVKTRDEFNQTGVYLLIGPKEDGEGDKLYLGEGDPIRPRLEDHYAKKDFWNRAIFFVAGSGQLNKAHIQFLESRLIQLAKKAKRVALENKKTRTSQRFRRLIALLPISFYNTCWGSCRYSVFTPLNKWKAQSPFGRVACSSVKEKECRHQVMKQLRGLL